MAMSLDSHVVGCGLSPRPSGLNSRWVCVHAQDPERRMEEKGLWHSHPPWVVISRFLSLCLSSKRTRPIAKTPQKKKNLLIREMAKPSLNYA